MTTQEEFVQLVDAYVDDLSAFLYSYAENKAQLKDWIQDIYLKLWKKKDEIDFRHPGFKSYLFTTARNHALKQLKKQKQYDEWVDQNLKRLTEIQQRDETQNNHTELKKRYHAAVSKIPSRSREAYVLSRQRGLTYKEIAHVMNISIKTVEAHISKALQVIRKDLASYSSNIVKFKEGTG